MKFNIPTGSALFGAGLVLVYTIISSFGDAAVKHLASDYAAPQLFVLSGCVVTLLAFLGAARKGKMSDLKTSMPGAMFIRSASTVASACLFFYAYRSLSLAEIFVFVGTMPIMAATISPFLLKESVGRGAWIALLAGAAGVLCLFPHGLTSITLGHVIAFGASFTGVISLVMVRYISRFESKPLALLLYPHLTMTLSMLAFLPFVFKSMSLIDFGIALFYSVTLYVGRYILIKAFSVAPTHVVMPVLNVQFLWMVLLGIGLFSETPAFNVYLGAAIVILSCIKLVFDAESATREGKVSAPIRIGMRSGRDKWPRSKSLSHNRTSSLRSGYRSQIARRSALR